MRKQSSALATVDIDCAPAVVTLLKRAALRRDVESSLDPPGPVRRTLATAADLRNGW
ncbi:hypothetical protein [Streptomyces sp. MNP-20]|uniref:hypothetical protein n=1 Tax=Streptomyces sp. MNP-20 TaxID=2721165 RepID=UPI001552A9D7|nr:hypothetical protein [Streptomyces sp. MNP-20]